MREKYPVVASMSRSKRERAVYKAVEVVPGEPFGEYRKRLEAVRRKQRVTWAYEHPVRAILGTALAIFTAGIIVAASGFLWWLFVITLLPWLLFHEWGKVRRDKRYWKRSMDGFNGQASRDENDP